MLPLTQIDTTELRVRSVIQVTRMILVKTVGDAWRESVQSASLPDLVRLAKDESYSRIQSMVSAVAVRPDTDWLHDPATWPKWTGAGPAERGWNSTRPALVLPFHDGDIPRFGSFFARWGQITLSGKRPRSQAMAMVVAYNGDLEHRDKTATRRLILSLWKQYVNPDNKGPKLFFLSLNQPELNHFDGAAASFYQLARFLPRFFFSMILMETDITPMRPHSWFSELDDEHRPTDCSSLWVEGSASMCDPWEYGQSLHKSAREETAPDSARTPGFSAGFEPCISTNHRESDKQDNCLLQAQNQSSRNALLLAARAHKQLA